MKAPKTLADLRPWDGNPRKLTADQQDRLRKSMDRFGDLSGIVFNRRTGNLVGGHQRWGHLPEDATIQLDGKRSSKPNAQGTVATGWVDIGGERWSYREVDVDQHVEVAMNLAANRHGEGAWDYGALPQLMQGLDGVLDDLELTGFDPDQLEVLLAVDYDPGEPQGTLEDHDRDDNEGGGQRIKLTRDQWEAVQQLAEAMKLEPPEAVAAAARAYLATLTAEAPA